MARETGPGPTIDPEPDRQALRRAFAVEPVLVRIETAETALGLAPETILHAGPAFHSPQEIPRPVLNAAVHAALLADVCNDMDAAEREILAGNIRLESAQDRGVVTPLAMAVNATTPLQVIADAAGGGACAYAPINDGNLHPARVGQRDEAVFQQLRWMSVAVADRLDAALREPVPLLPLAREGLDRGDDCHGLTAHASRALVAALRARLRNQLGDAVATYLDGAPGLFLNLWMGATRCIMQGGAGVPGSGMVTGGGGNGVDVGIQVSGLPGRWFTAPATPPAGALPEGMEGRALGAIGDSAVVELLGLGAMALHCSPEQSRALGPWLPRDLEGRMDLLLAAPHPGFTTPGLRFGITAARAARCGAGPAIGLGILDRDGRAGRLGGGIYDMPTAPFRDALAALEAAGR